MSFTISADTGGTFIDVVVSDQTGRKTIGKALTTHGRTIDGLMASLDMAAHDRNRTGREILGETSMFFYGTTRATNAIVTRNVAKTAFLTTEGFPDTLVLKEGGLIDGLTFRKDFPDPYIAKSDTFEVTERIDAEGGIVTALDETKLIDTLTKIQSRGYSAIAVSFIWSISNPVHEVRVGELIEQVVPGVSYTLSHRLAPILREYRRASATAIDASLKPLMQEHFRGFENDLRSAGFGGKFLVSTSIGGVMDVGEVIGAPIHSAKSGPAMAPVAGITYSKLESLGGNMIVCDAGGTTFDVGTSRRGELVFARDTWLGEQLTGDLLGISSVDIQSVGAGGGSVAWVDDGGLLRVGPQSAGSDPGPACYGKGGTEPTVSDAATVLGYFNPRNFLGGQMALDVDAARAAVSRVAISLDLSVEKAAWGILTLATDAMVKAVDEITVKRGVDPGESTIVAGGGAAGINIMQIAKELGSTNVVLPRMASALSATGMHFADILKEETEPIIVSTERFDFDRINAVLEKLRSSLARFVDRLELTHLPNRIELIAESRYEGQVWELDVPLKVDRFDGQLDVDNFVRDFNLVHEQILAVRDPHSAVEIITIKGRAIVEFGDTPSIDDSVDGLNSSESRRYCFFGRDEPELARIIGPGALRPGDRVDGPAIIEEPTTTLVVYPGMSAVLSTNHNYILHTEG